MTGDLTESYIVRKARMKESGQVQRSILLDRGDQQFLDYIRTELGISTSDAIRTALRVYHAILVQGKRSA
jgi:hypothetical protein